MEQHRPSDTEAVTLLRDHPRARRVMIADQYRRLHTDEAARGLLAEARGYRSARPDRAREWARLAWHSACRLTGDNGRGLQALALAEDGNACRLLGLWRRAGDRLGLAEDRVAVEPESEAALEVRLLVASYAIQAEQWMRALDALADATRLANAHQDRDALYRATLKRGIAAKEMGRYADAVDLCREARRIAGPEQWHQRLVALHNGVTALVDAGMYGDAAETLRVMAPQYQRAPQPAKARRLWLEGRIAGGLGRWGEACRALREARLGMVEGAHYWEAAELVADEAEALFHEGRLGEVFALAEASLGMFESMGLERQAERAAQRLRLAAAGMVGAITSFRRLLRQQRAGVS